MKQSISLFLLISMFSLQSQSSQSSLQVIEMIKGQKDLGAQSYVQIKETRGRQVSDQKLSIFGWIKLSQFEQNINPLLKLSFANNSSKMYKDLENFALINYNHQTKKIQLTYFEERYNRKLESFQFPMSRDEWVFISLGLNFQDKKIQLYASQQNKTFEAVVWKILKMDIDMVVPQQFQLSIGCFPAQSDLPESVATKCTTGHIKDFSYINNYLKNPSMNFMLDDDYLLANNFVFDGSNEKNLIIYPKSQKANAIVLTGQKQYEQLGSTKIQLFSGQNQLTAKGLFLSDQRLNTTSTFTIYMKMSFRNPTYTMNLMKLKLTNGDQLLVQIKRGHGKKYYLDFSIKNRGFQFSTGDFMKINQVSNFSLSFIREGDLFWVMFIEPQQKLASSKIPLGDFSSTEFQILDSNFNSVHTQFKFFRLSTNNQSSGPALNFAKTFDKKSKCQWEIGTSKKEDRCLSCKHNFVMLPKYSTCNKFCPFGFQNILGVCYKCKDDQCSKLTKKFLDIKKISENIFNVTLINPIYMRGIKVKDLFHVKVENEKFSDDYAYNKTLISKNPYVVQFEFIFRDIKKDHLVTFTLRNEKIYSISRNAIPRQIVSFYTGYQNSYPLKEEFVYANNNQTDPNKMSFLKKRKRRVQNKPIVQYKSIDEQLDDQIRQTNEYLLQQNLEKAYKNPGIIPMELPRMDKNGYVGRYNRYIPQQQPYDFNNFKQTKTELPFVNRQSYTTDNKFYEKNPNLLKINGRQDPLEYKFQDKREYFYPLDSKINKQQQQKVIYYPQNLDQQVFYPKSNPLDNVLRRKIQQDKQRKQNQLFFYPIEDRFEDDSQFLKNFPLLDKHEHKQQQNKTMVQNKGLTMLKEHDQKKYNLENLKNQFKDYDYEKNKSYQQQPDIVEQYRRNHVLNNVFSTYNDQQQLDDIFSKYNDQQQLDVVFQKYNNKQKLDDIFSKYNNKQKLDDVFSKYNNKQKLDDVFNTYNNKQQLDDVFSKYNNKQQLDIVFQNYNGKKKLENVFQTYNNKQKLDTFFNQYNEQKQQNEILKIQNQELHGQLQFLQNLFNVYYLNDKSMNAQQSTVEQPQKQVLKDHQNAILQQPDIELDERYLVKNTDLNNDKNIQQHEQDILKKEQLNNTSDISKDQNKNLNAFNLNSQSDSYLQNIITAKSLKNNQHHHQNHQEKYDDKIEYILAIIVYVTFIIGLIFGILKFFLNIYNKQKFSTISLIKLAQIILFMQLFSFWSIIINENSVSLTHFLNYIRRLFLNDQVIWKVDNQKDGYYQHQVDNNTSGYNLLEGNDEFQKQNISNLFFQNFSLMSLLIFVMIILYLILKFVSRRQQKQAMDNYIQEGHYKLQNGHYKLALFLEQFCKKIIPLLVFSFALEISIFGIYNLFYVRKWTGYDLFSFMLAILFIFIFVYQLCTNNCSKKTKSKKLKKKCKKLDNIDQSKDQSIGKLKILGFTFFLMGVLTVFLQNYVQFLLFCQFILAISLIFSSKHKDQRKYFTIEQIITYASLTSICISQFFIIKAPKNRELEFEVIFLMVYIIVECTVVLIYNFFVNDHRVVNDMEIQDEKDNEEDLEALSLNISEKQKKKEEITVNDFKKMSDQIY